MRHGSLIAGLVQHGLDLMCPHAVHCWRSTGTLVSFGGASGPAQLSASELRPKSRRWGWFGVFNAYGQLDVWARGVANLVPLIASGAVEPYITGVYAREQAPEAHRLLEGRARQGKLALVHPD